MILKDRGDIKSPIWVILDAPYDTDTDKGYLLSGGYGFIFDKMWKEAGINVEPFITCFKPDIEVPNAYRNIVGDLDQLRPPFIVPLGDCVSRLCKTTQKKNKKGNVKFEASLEKYAGSLLTADELHYDHYVIPCVAPDYIARDWAYRDIAISIDLGRVREEFNYFSNNKHLDPLPIRHLLTEPSFSEVMGFLNSLRNRSYISTDIETIRPRKSKEGSSFLHHPGYPYTISFAYDSKNAISFSLWDYDPEENLRIWREVDYLLTNVPQIGQNYFTFDSHFLEALGFRPCLNKCQDTLIRHHILWPELPHKLQFQTKQYTRQPYYKDEGKQWSPKYKKALMKYNCLDTTVTYEVFERQEEEFAERPYLK